MNLNSLGSISHQYLQNLFGTGAPGSTSTNSSSSTSSSTSTQASKQLSPFAQMLSELQQLEQTSPTQYSKLTSQISTKLQTAAQSAQQQGDTTLATQLTTLSKDFTSASQTGQLPNVQDLAKTVSAAHQRGMDSAGNAALFQYLNQSASNAAGSATNSQSLNPMSIITSSLNGSASS